MVTILCTNDDGINSPGLAGSVRVCKDLGARVLVYAPENQRTSTGGHTTYRHAVRFRATEFLGCEAYAVDGYPMDVMRLALLGHNQKPDIVVSGINMGEQLGFVPVFMSGTCSAAVFAAAYLSKVGKKKPVLALGYTPQNDNLRTGEHNDPMENFGTESYPLSQLEKIIQLSLIITPFPGDFWNVNFPHKPTEEIAVVPMGVYEHWDEWVEIGKGSFLNKGRIKTNGFTPHTDADQFMQGKITITPCRLDITDFEALLMLRRHLREGFYPEEPKYIRG